MSTKSIIGLLCAGCLALGGCTPRLHAPTALPNPVVPLTLQSPVAGEVYAVGQHVLLTASAQPRRSSVRRIEFLANGSPIALGDPADIRNFFSSNWVAPLGGEYYIQARITLQDGSSAVSEPHWICVMPFSGGPYWGPFLPGEFPGPCGLPTQIPNHANSGEVAVHVVVAPSAVLFAQSPCTAPPPTVTFIATVDDPQDLVVLAYETFVLDAPGPQHRVDGWLNWITTRPGNQKEYRRTINLDSSFAPYDATHQPLGVNRWAVFVYGVDGQDLASDHGDLPALTTTCSQQPLIIGPSATPQVLELFPSETPAPQLAPVVLPTFTFSKNAFCRKGPDTSFPDVTAIVAGDTVDILNVSEDGFWYYVFWKQFNARCWVAASTGAANGNLSGLKVLVGPELPQPGVPPAGKKPSPAPPPCNPLIKVCP